MDHHSGEITSQLKDINMIQNDINLHVNQPLSTSIYIYANELGRGINYDSVFVIMPKNSKYYSQISPSIDVIDYVNIIHLNCRNIIAIFKQI